MLPPIQELKNSSKNGGVSNARTMEFKAASNELIAFIDADDFWSLDFFNADE